MKKHSNKEVVALFEEYTGKPSSYRKLEKFLKEKGLFYEFEIGKWYKGVRDALLYCKTSGESVHLRAYGFNYAGKWDNSPTINTSGKGWVEATHKEVEEALIREWEKKCNYKNNIQIKFDNQAYPMTLDIDFSKDKYEYDMDEDILQIGGMYIYQQGEFATVIKEAKEMTIHQIQKELGYDIKIVK